MHGSKKLPLLGCGGCCLSRRSFLAGCAAGIACSSATVSGASLWAADAGKKLRIRTVFTHPTPETITWPNIGFDYDSRAKQLLAQLAPLCPQLDFLPVHTITVEDAHKVVAGDAEVDGYLIVSLGMKGQGAIVTGAAGRSGRPMVFYEDQYCGPASLGYNARAEKAEWKSIGVATSRIEDLASVLRAFDVLAKPGAKADDFVAAAKAAYKKIIATPGDLTCPDDKVTGDVDQCLKKLRTAKILVVGREGGAHGKAIHEEFGVKVVALKFPELHEAFLQADPGKAAHQADMWMSRAEKVVEPSRDEVVKSAAMSLAMESLLAKYDAQAITINCLGGFYSGQLQAFPCLGFVELNDRGLVGACEGDLMSTVTMLAMSQLTGRPGYISDPVIDLATNQIIYAHCVAPTKVFGPQGPTNPYHIRSHSEDRKGAAVRSLMPVGRITTSLKFIPGLRQVVMHQAKAVANPDEDKACRSKLAAEVIGDIDKLFSGWTHGWHRVTFYGDLRQPLSQLCEAMKIKVVEEA